MTERKAVRLPVTGGLLLAWVVNDAEEWVTMGPWSRRHGLPRSGGLSDRRVHVAIVVMGAVVTACAARGVGTGGRSRFFQAGLLGFGLHGFGHLGNSLHVRGYTPGVVTAPVVIGYWLWARRELGRSGIRYSEAGIVPGAMTLLAAALGLAHGTAIALDGESHEQAGLLWKGRRSRSTTSR